MGKCIIRKISTGRGYIYGFGRTEKGIAIHFQKVNVDLEYTIDNTYKDGEYIKKQSIQSISA